MTNNNDLNFASTAVSHHSIYKNQNVVLKDDQPTFKYIWEKSSTAEEDIQQILRYFENRSIPVDESFLKALGIRLNRYNGETSIIVPIRNLQDELVKIHQIFINGEGKRYARSHKVAMIRITA